jgi:hypothetical protein
VPIVVTEVRAHQLGRLSRNLGPTGHDKLLVACETIWRGYSEAGEMGRAERASLGRMVWRNGRNAARQALRAPAQGFFRLARTIAGRDAVNASAAFRLLYYLFPPYRAERVGEAIKRVVRQTPIGKRREGRG